MIELFTSNRFDIVARVESDPLAWEVPSIMQTFLAERFKLPITRRGSVPCMRSSGPEATAGSARGSAGRRLIALQPHAPQPAPCRAAYPPA